MCKGELDDYSDVDHLTRMTEIAGLDLSLTSTGFSCGPIHEAIPTQPSLFDNEYHRYTYIGDRILTYLAGTGCKLVVVEGYAMMSQKVVPLAELGCHVRMRLLDHGFRLCIVPPAALKKWVTGAGNADKTAMAIEALKRWGFQHKSHDVVDAYCLAKAGEHLEKHKSDELRKKVRFL